MTFAQLVKWHAGGQKSSQDRKEAHKAKRKAKKGEDAVNGPAAITAAPTAEALAAVGASQMSKAAQDRRQEIDRNKAAASGADQSTAGHAVAPAGHAVRAEGSQAAEKGEGGMAGARAQNGHAVPALPSNAGDQAEGEEVSSASSSEGDEAELDAAGGPEVGAKRLSSAF